MSPQNDTVKGLLDDAESQDVDSIDSFSIKSSINGLPTDHNGYVPKSTTLSVYRSGSRCRYTGMVFALDNQQTHFAEFRNWNASAKRNEIIIRRGDEGSGPQAGAINFHHWLCDQSRRVELTLGDGSSSSCSGIIDQQRDDVIEITRPHVFARHTFVMNGREMTWQQVRGEGAQKTRRFYQRHLKCVDSEGNEMATFWLESYRGKGDEKLAGNFEVQQEGLEPEVVEGLMLTFLAVYVKLRKRAMQSWQAGNIGGLVMLSLYAVQG